MDISPVDRRQLTPEELTMISATIESLAKSGNDGTADPRACRNALEKLMEAAGVHGKKESLNTEVESCTPGDQAPREFHPHPLAQIRSKPTCIHLSGRNRIVKKALLGRFGSGCLLPCNHFWGVVLQVDLRLCPLPIRKVRS